jgi:hypothetical protein
MRVSADLGGYAIKAGTAFLNKAAKNFRITGGDARATPRMRVMEVLWFSFLKKNCLVADPLRGSFSTGMTSGNIYLGLGISASSNSVARL